MHLVSLQQAAGVEAHFAAFVRRARASHPEWSQGWLNPSREMHPFIADQVGATLASRIDAKRRGFLKVPSFPTWLRAAHCRSALKTRTNERRLGVEPDRPKRLRPRCDRALSMHSLGARRGVGLGPRARSGALLAAHSARDCEFPAHRHAFWSSNGAFAEGSASV